MRSDSLCYGRLHIGCERRMCRGIRGKMLFIPVIKIAIRGGIGRFEIPYCADYKYHDGPVIYNKHARHDAIRGQNTQ